MLTARRPSLAALRVAAAVMMMVGFLIAFAPAQQTADADDCWQWVEASPGHWVYYNTCETPGGGGGGDGDGGGGDGEPTCDLSNDPYNEFCYGEDACWGRVPALWSGDGFDEPRPSPDAILGYRQCQTPDGDSYPTWYWIESDGPSLLDLAIEAVGNLEAPPFTLDFNPPGRGYVFLATWFWAEGAGDESLTGTSAAGLVAVATPSEVELDPGDGSGVITCPWSSAEGDACAHTYLRASIDGGSVGPEGEPAYLAEAQLIYTVHFELFGNEIDIPGAPDQFESDPPEQVPVPVAEIQAIVQ